MRAGFCMVHDASFVKQAAKRLVKLEAQVAKQAEAEGVDARALKALVYDHLAQHPTALDAWLAEAPKKPPKPEREAAVRGPRKLPPLSERQRDALAAVAVLEREHPEGARAGHVGKLGIEAGGRVGGDPRHAAVSARSAMEGLAQRRLVTMLPRPWRASLTAEGERLAVEDRVRFERFRAAFSRAFSLRQGAR